jgi:hypothetical protein
MYTPFSGLSDTELMLEVANKQEATPLEIELTERLHQLRENLYSITSGRYPPDPFPTNYVGD